MDFIKETLNGQQYPKMIRVRQNFDGSKIDDVAGAVMSALNAPKFQDAVGEGMRIAVTCGSRGIANIAEIVRTVVHYCLEKGAEPFVVPAMGSHGGATAEGQRAILASLGVTEETVGCEIRSSMETVKIGESADGHDIRIDKNASGADGIILINRIKPHTSFRGRFESGLMKMMAIGLGKQSGAESCHESGFKYMADMVHEFGSVILEKANILMGVGIFENAYDETALIEGLLPSEIEEREPELLKTAADRMPKLYFDRCELLIVDRIGKNISGTGMDPNISGAFGTPYASGGIEAQRRCILDLTDETHGGAYGMGAADVITRRLYDKIDFSQTYPNAVTSTTLSFVRVPMTVDSDREAIGICLKTCVGSDKAHPRVVRIRDTASLEDIMISESMLAEAQQNDCIDILSGPEDMDFDDMGNLF